MSSAAATSETTSPRRDSPEFSVMVLRGSGSVIVGKNTFLYDNGDAVLTEIGNPEHRIFVYADDLARDYVAKSAGVVSLKATSDLTAPVQRLAVPTKPFADRAAINDKTPQEALVGQGSRSAELLKAYQHDLSVSSLRALLQHLNHSFVMSALYLLGKVELEAAGSVPTLAQDLEQFRLHSNGSLRVARAEILAAIPRLSAA